MFVRFNKGVVDGTMRRWGWTGLVGLMNETKPKEDPLVLFTYLKFASNNEIV